MTMMMAIMLFSCCVAGAAFFLFLAIVMVLLLLCRCACQVRGGHDEEKLQRVPHPERARSERTAENHEEEYGCPQQDQVYGECRSFIRAARSSKEVA